MDMTAALRYFSDHIEHVIGGLVVLFLLTSILLLIRNIKDGDGHKGHDAGDAGRTGSDNLDIGAIESAMKRVLASQGLSSAAAVGASKLASDHAATSPAPVEANADASQLTQAIQERDTKLQELAREIDRLNSEVTLSKATPAAAGAADGSGKVAELQTKIEELQARLTEYEIIEDDIADLSLFKEENAQLKSELEKLRSESSAGVSFGGQPVARVVVANEEAPTPEADTFVNTLVEEAQTIASKDVPANDPDANPAQAAIDDLLAQMAGAEPAAVAPAEQPKRSESQPVSQDEVDRLFALAPTESTPSPAAVPEKEDSTQLAATADELSAIATQLGEAPADAATENSIFETSLDTDKMLSEVEALGEGNESGDVLSESLDTEKLLAEMSSIDSEEKPPVSAAEKKAAPQPAPFNPEEEPVGEDDLLAEFKDPTDGGQR